jgi:drug/metabolite transporter (DMT)-like permease
VAQGLASGTVVFVSFICGVAIFREPVVSGVYAAVGLALLLSGIAVIVCSKLYFNSSAEQSSVELCDSIGHTLAEGTDRKYSVEADYILVDDPGEVRGDSSTTLSLYGVCLTLAGGIAFGVSFVPLHFETSPNCEGLGPLWSVGIGFVCAAIVAPVFRRALFPEQNDKGALLFERLVETVRQFGLPCILAGVIFGVAVVCIAIAIPKIGYAVAGPLFQCAVVVNGLWGVFFFRELRGNAVGVFFLGAVAVIVGASILTLAT